MDEDADEGMNLGLDCVVNEVGLQLHADVLNIYFSV